MVAAKRIGHVGNVATNTAAIAGIGFALLVLSACGGGGKKTAEEPEQSGGTLVDNPPEYEPVDDTLVPPEKFDAINQTLERKGPAVSRCYAAALEDERLPKTAKGTVIVALVISQAGKSQDVKILPTSTIREKGMEACVIAEIERARFTTLPKNLDFTYTYRLERDY